MKVLYLNHVGLMGGASTSLLEMLNALPDKEINKYVICQRGNFSKKLDEQNIPNLITLGLSIFCNSEYGYYRNFRWIVLLREFFLIPFTFYILIKAKLKWGNFDIIHLNDITLIPCVFILKLIFFKTKIITSVRCIQRKRKNLIYKSLHSIYKKYIDIFICIDKNVYHSLPSDLNKICIHNIHSFKKFPKIKKSYDKNFTVGMVGLINKSKGVFDFLKAASLSKNLGYKIEFHFYGDQNEKTKSLSHKIRKILNLHENVSLELKKIVENDKLRNVKFIKFDDKIENIYANLDVLCFPSLLDAPGRPVFEAGFYKIPSIVAISKMYSDTFVDNVTGLKISKNNHKELFDKILYLYKNKKILQRLSLNAYNLSVRNFNPQKNGKKFLKTYKKLLKL